MIGVSMIKIIKECTMRQTSVATFLMLGLTLVFSTIMSASETRSNKSSEPVAITSLVMRDRVITISSLPTGLKYTVSTKDGTVIDAALSEAQLVAKYPEIYDHLRPAIANPNATEKIIPWAGR
jgi:exo-beta-1,3-glucanase (GH17 family)